MARNPRQLLGRTGEDRAASWYEAEGYEILARNWRRRDGEIDLVARKGRIIVFCEVKARTTDSFGMPAEAVTKVKQARIRRLAARWLTEEGAGAPGQIRFDVAAILGGTLEVLEGVF